MPINIPSDLPAYNTLINENIFVMTPSRAMHQDIRPLSILIVNLMPLKEDTELHILRMLSNTPLQVDVSFIAMKTHTPANTSKSHLNKFYQTIDEVENEFFDGMI